MKKLFIPLVIVMITESLLNASQLFIEVRKDSTIKIFLNEFYAITDKSNAKYFRICKMPDSKNNPDNLFSDYLMDSTLIIKGNYSKGLLNDSVIFYYDKGKLKKRGYIKMAFDLVNGFIITQITKSKKLLFSVIHQ